MHKEARSTIDMANVSDITDLDLETLTKVNTDPICVMFYARYCPASFKASKTFEKVAEQMALSQMTFAALELSVREDVEKQQEIESLPTIKVYNRGSMQEFDDYPLSERKLTTFLQNFTNSMRNSFRFDDDICDHPPLKKRRLR